MAGSRPQVTFTLGVSGTGKTYCRVLDVVEDWLPHYSGIHFSNLPFDVEAIARHFDQLDQVAGMKVSGDDVRKRVRRIERDVLEEWVDGKSGPWDYFGEADLKGAHICLDEAYRFVGNSGPASKLRAQWVKWISTLRHSGATVEFICQTAPQLAKEVLAGGELFAVLVPPNQRTWWGFRVADLFQIAAKWQGCHVGAFYEDLYSPDGRGAAGRQWIGEKVRMHKPWVFELYNSYNNVEAEGDETTEAVDRNKDLWERLSWFQLTWYMWKTYRDMLTFRAAMAVALVAGVWYGWHAIHGAMATMFVTEKKPVPAETLAELPSEPTLAPPRAPGPLLIEPSLGAPPEQIAQAQKAATARLMANDRVYWGSGEVTQIDQQIKDGVLRGRKLVSIDVRARTCVLSDGRVLRLGVPPLVDGLLNAIPVGSPTRSTSTPGGGEIRRFIRPASGPDAGATSSDGRPIGVDLSGPDGAPALPAVVPR